MKGKWVPFILLLSICGPLTSISIRTCKSCICMSVFIWEKQAGNGVCVCGGCFLISDLCLLWNLAILLQKHCYVIYIILLCLRMHLLIWSFVLPLPSSLTGSQRFVKGPCCTRNINPGLSTYVPTLDPKNEGKLCSKKNKDKGKEIILQLGHLSYTLLFWVLSPAIPLGCLSPSRNDSWV